MTEQSLPEESIFLRALDIKSDGERNEYLDQACGENAKLRGEVEALLRAHDKSGDLLDLPESPDPTIDQPITEKPGTQIGPYKLLQQVGEGGMGVVYMAEQKEPVKRRVALKIIKPGMDTRQVIARFEAERQALAMMDHPNIAKVLDAGQTDSGRPYFVMELVKGVPVTQYCDEQHLNPKERLELFVPICQAVQHAHQKGIIHRDIKPSNILVALFDGQPVPKVIDFGVAKATNQTLTEKTMFTQLGQVVGTLEYMSPEQAQVNQLDVDTRSDIYSLGVLLYELLTGDTPFDRQRLRSAAFDEMLRIIREEEPPKPSTKLSSSETLPSIAANRHVDPQKLTSDVRGELDWIVMKALEKDRARRYETASKFAEDVQHYLNDEPVAACPPSRAYRFKKFARRNKTALATAAVVATAVVLGLVGTTWQMIRAVNAEKLASSRYEDAEAERNRADNEAESARESAARAESEAEKARTEAAVAKAVNAFLKVDLLGGANPRSEPNRELKVREVLDRASQKIEGRFAEQPIVKASIRRTIAGAYHELGLYDDSDRHFIAAHKLYQERLGDEDEHTIKVGLALSWNAYKRRDDLSELHDRLVEMVDKCRRLFDENSPTTLHAMSQLASCKALLPEHYGEAVSLHEHVAESMRRNAGPRHEDTLTAAHDLAITYAVVGQYDKSVKMLEDLLKLEREVFGAEDDRTITTMGTLAWHYWHVRRYEEAAKIQQTAFALKKKVLGPNHDNTLTSANWLGLSLKSLKRLDEAQQVLKDALDISRQAKGEAHTLTLELMESLASVYMRQKHHDKALPLYTEYLQHRRDELGLAHPKTLVALANLTLQHLHMGQTDEAQAVIHDFEQGFNKLRDNLADDHLEVIKARHMLADRSTTLSWILSNSPNANRRDPQKAIALAKKAALLEPDHPNHWNNLGVAFFRAEDWAAAVENLNKADQMTKDGDRAHRMFLAMALWKLGEKTKAKERYVQGAAWISEHARNGGEQHRFRAEAETTLGIDADQREALIKQFIESHSEKATGAK